MVTSGAGSRRVNGSVIGLAVCRAAETERGHVWNEIFDAREKLFVGHQV